MGGIRGEVVVEVAAEVVVEAVAEAVAAVVYLYAVKGPLKVVGTVYFFPPI